MDEQVKSVIIKAEKQILEILTQVENETKFHVDEISFLKTELLRGWAIVDCKLHGHF